MSTLKRDIEQKEREREREKERERERERERRTNKKRITIETSNRVGVFRYSVNWLIYISNNSCFEHKRTNYSINAIYPFDGEEK